MSVFVGLDVGTQSVKLVAYDPEAGRSVFVTGVPLELIHGDDGAREQRAEWWTDAVSRCFSAMPAALRARVRGIGVSGQQHGFVPLGADGRVLAPVKLWNDTSTDADGRRIMAAAGGRACCVALAGNPVPAGYTASKLPWTRRHRPEVYRDLHTILLPHDYIDFWLTGERWMEHGDASGTGWLDVRTRQWSPELLAATDPDRDLAACLPPLVAPDASFPIRAQIAAELGLPTGVRVSAGGGDNMMAAIGTGNVQPGRLTVSLGTSGTLFAYADRPVVDDDARWAAFCDSTGGWLPLICTMNCTVATETMARLFGIAAGDGDALVEATEPGAGGLVLLPFFSGERTPDLPAGRGCLTGMDLHNTTPAHLYRAAMEGATYSLRHGYDAFVDAGLRFERLCLTGGGSRSAAWRQLVADVFELPVEIPQEGEGAAFGAALQALWACGRAAGAEDGTLAQTVQAHVRTDAAATAAPRPAQSRAYRAHYATFLRHLAAVRPLYATTDDSDDDPDSSPNPQRTHA
ncbi:xylulokinase [Luteimonas salinilitoris]|uniref:Xylulose kinase n=1 Tax=Luteimonas salinilitoris TaxID=3237697 RepID=A0ABV4HX65_9GAMM